MIKRFQAIFIAVLGLLYAPTSFATPTIVVSIRPIHSLVAALTEGVTTPTLLMKGTTSPHHYTLRPSEMKLLSQADFFFFVGSGLENYLSPVLKALPGRAKVIELVKTPGLELLSYQTEHDHHHDHETHGHTQYDPHIWLDPIRMSLVSQFLMQELIKMDPSHREQYQANAQKLQNRLLALDKTLAKQLAPLKDKSFLTFHDAYAYLQDRYQLKSSEFIVQHPEQPLSAKQLARLQKEVQQGKYVCVFLEPQFSAKAVNILTADSTLKVGVLDPIGSSTPGPEQYFEMMSTLANALETCLL